jgi:hypothetical protein
VRVLRKLFGFLMLVGVAFAGIVVYRRRFAARRERIDLYYEDGSLVSLTDAEAAPLLERAREALRATRAA